MSAILPTSADSVLLKLSSAVMAD